jgi:uncharacterized membrane protein YukC
MGYLNDANKEIDKVQEQMQKKEAEKRAAGQAKSKLAKEQAQHEDNKKQGMI